jgi:hypothetical protein
MKKKLKVNVEKFINSIKLEDKKSTKKPRRKKRG